MGVSNEFNQDKAIEVINSYINNPETIPHYNFIKDMNIDSFISNYVKYSWVSEGELLRFLGDICSKSR